MGRQGYLEEARLSGAEQHHWPSSPEFGKHLSASVLFGPRRSPVGKGSRGDDEPETHTRYLLEQRDFIAKCKKPGTEPGTFTKVRAIVFIYFYGRAYSICKFLG